MTEPNTSAALSLLVVDDDPDIINYIDNILPPEDYLVHSTDSAQAALDMLEQQHFNIVITAANLSEMDGIELCHQIRQQQHNPYNYLLLTVEKDAEEAVGSGIHAGADDYLFKPLSTIPLLAKLHIARQQLQLRRQIGELQRNIAEKSSYDTLTHCHNRNHFIKTLQNEVLRAERYKRSMGVAICNIDGISQVNAQMGNSAGDELIRQVAARLTEVIRNVDFIARMDGDEFALIMPETRTSESMLVAQRLRESIAEAVFDLNGQECWATVRVGVAGLNKVDSERHTPDAILAYAKYFIDRGKAGGGNRTNGLDISTE